MVGVQEQDETKLLHISDTHLGYVAYGQTRRAEDFEQAFIEAIDIAIDQDVDGVVHTGDITHESAPNGELPQSVISSLEELSAAGISFYFVLGNHDITPAGHPQGWAESLVAADLGLHLGREPRACRNVSLYGLDYHDNEWWESPDLTFDLPGTDTTPILALHQSVTPPRRPEYSETTLYALQRDSNVSFDLALLGHSHYTTKYDDEVLSAHYTGATERTTRSYRTDTPVVAEFYVTSTGITTQTHALDVRPFQTFCVSLPPGSSIDQIGSDLDQFDVAGAVVTIYTDDHTDRQTIESLFETAGAFDARAWSWDGDRDLPPGVTEVPRNHSIDALLDVATSEIGAGAETAETVGETSGEQNTPEGETAANTSTTGSLVHLGTVDLGREPLTDATSGRIGTAFENVVTTAIEAGVNAVVLTGRLFVPDPSESVIERCHTQLSRLAAADIPLLYTLPTENEAVTTLEDDGLLHRLTPTATDVGPLSIYGAAADTFHQDLVQIQPDNDHGFGVIASTATVSPPGPADTADWNLTQIGPLIGDETAALLLGSGAPNHQLDGDRVLAYSGDLAPPLDQDCFADQWHSGGYTVISFDSTGVPAVDERDLSGPSVVTRTLEFRESPAYDDVWDRLDDLALEGSHVRLRVHGVGPALRTRITRRIQRIAASVIIWGDDEAVVDGETVHAPGTDRNAVTDERTADTTHTFGITDEVAFSDSPTETPPAGTELRDSGAASIIDRDENQCGFVLDIDAWCAAGDDRTSNVHRRSLYGGKWYCPHDCEDGNETCIFHTPRSATDETLERKRFYETLEEAVTRYDLQFYGASLTAITTSGHDLTSSHRYPIDLQHATIDRVSITDTRIQQPIRFDRSTIDGAIYLDNAQLDDQLSLVHATVDGTVTIKRSTLSGRPRFGHGHFTGKTTISQSEFDHGFALGEATFTAPVHFSNCTVSGHATGYETTFHQDLRLNRTTFTLECRFDGATFHSDVSVNQSRFNQLFGLRNTTVTEALTVRRSTLAGPFEITDASLTTVALTDSTCQNIVECARSRIDQFDWSHVTVTGQTRFTATTFGHLSLTDVTFEDNVRLLGDSPGPSATPATVHGACSISHSIFHRPVKIEDAGFADECSFSTCTFHGDIEFDSVTVRADLAFTDSTVNGRLDLDGVLDGALSLTAITCTDQISLQGVEAVQGRCTARHATVTGQLALTDTRFEAGIDLRDARVTGDTNLEAIDSHGPLTGDNAAFDGEVTLAGSTITDTVSFTAATFGDVARFTQIDQQNQADVSFEDARFHAAARFIGASITGNLSFEQARVSGPARRDGIECGGDAVFAGAEFDEAAQFFHATIDARLDADTTAFHETANFDDAAVGDAVTFTQAVFEHNASFENITVAGRLVFDDTQFDASIRTAGATVSGTLSATRISVDGTATFDDTTVTGQCRFDRATFHETVSFADATLEEGCVFDEATIDESADFNEITVTGGTATFTTLELNGPATFNDVTVTDDFDMTGATVTDRCTFTDMRVGGTASFTEAHFEDVTTLTAATFEEPASFDDAAFTAAVYFDRTTFVAGATFCDATLAAPHFTHAHGKDVEINCYGATLTGGEIVHAADAGVTYNLTKATLGPIRIRGPDEHPPDYSAFRLVETRFDGFEFAEHTTLRDPNARLEVYTGDAATPTASQLETTYLNAKNGAAQVGDSLSEGTFFVRELRHRGRTHREANRRRRWVGNRVLRHTANYGQSPMRVVGTSFAVIGIFGAVFATVPFVAPSVGGNHSALYTHPLGPWLLSFEAFTTLVFGGVSVTSIWTRFLGAVEGFFGAFLIALYLYALTQSIDR
ncbi:hypothetical protein DJ82_06615 [Halorubrum sp. Ib24]|uniref:pentapeptide repeat-containing protein n=1 Tax=Halorubrum sp. Ib24 TaxID=1383850 RepID=UPI000B9900D9|nr:pentapeptide repeat-containing protein [Halorubrum sp. Ib24]OYR40759.1 hypothetical protein DJ82_06615 [Halorubrum sp. Ib24]